MTLKLFERRAHGYSAPAMRILAALLALLLLTTYAPRSLYRDPPLPSVPRLTAEAVALVKDEPVRDRVGRLRFLAGWRLTSNDRRFGGISALHVEGGTVTGLTDAGNALRFALPEREGSQPLAIIPLPDAPGANSQKRDRDTEAMAIAGGHAWAAYERRNEVWRYTFADWKPEAGTRPPAMRRWRANAGGEAMLRFPDRRFLIFSEGGRDDSGISAALLFDGDPAEEGTSALRLGYRAPAGFRITDAALLPGGRVLFLNRRFAILEGITVKLTLAELRELKEGAVIAGQEIAHFDRPIITDNYEALSVTVEKGRPILWIASDDNFTPLQRTLLLKFALIEE